MWLSRITSVEIREQKRRPPPQTHTEESNKYPIWNLCSVSVCTRIAMGVSTGPCACANTCACAVPPAESVFSLLGLELDGKCLFIVYSILMCVVCHGRDFCWSLCAHLLSRAHIHRECFSSEMKVEKNASLEVCRSVILNADKFTVCRVLICQSRFDNVISGPCYFWINSKWLMKIDDKFNFAP